MLRANLDIGLSTPLHIRHERLSQRQDATRLLYISDIHLRRHRSDALCRQILDAARSTSIDLFLLGGDLVDTPSELSSLCQLVADLSAIAPVFAVAGNHDLHVGLHQVRSAVFTGGGLWIHEGYAQLPIRSRLITISGPGAAASPPGDVHVLCAHHPHIWKTARSKGYDLVLAGHLHGCQVVAFEHRGHLFPGAFFYSNCYTSHQEGSTRLIVSRGVSDLIPIRWQCPREVVLCSV